MNLTKVVQKLQKDIAELTKLIISLRATGGGGGGAHNLLSSMHPDTTIAAPQRGDIITGQGATPKWTRLAKAAAGWLIGYNATDIVAINPTFLGLTDTPASYVAQVDKYVKVNAAENALEFGRRIFVSDSSPGAGDGENGDIWLEW